MTILIDQNVSVLCFVVCDCSYGFKFRWCIFCFIIEPCHEIMVLVVFRKLILQSRMQSHPVGIDGRTLGLLSYFMFANSECSGETARMHRLT